MCHARIREEYWGMCKFSKVVSFQRSSRQNWRTSVILSRAACSPIDMLPIIYRTSRRSSRHNSLYDWWPIVMTSIAMNLTGIIVRHRLKTEALHMEFCLCSGKGWRARPLKIRIYILGEWKTFNNIRYYSCTVKLVAIKIMIVFAVGRNFFFSSFCVAPFFGSSPKNVWPRSLAIFLCLSMGHIRKVSG